MSIYYYYYLYFSIGINRDNIDTNTNNSIDTGIDRVIGASTGSGMNTVIY